jgi:hypothetical protein
LAQGLSSVARLRRQKPGPKKSNYFEKSPHNYRAVYAYVLRGSIGPPQECSGADSHPKEGRVKKLQEFVPNGTKNFACEKREEARQVGPTSVQVA